MTPRFTAARFLPVCRFLFRVRTVSGRVIAVGLFGLVFLLTGSNPVTAQSNATPAIRYVKPVATGTGTGDSWANASGNLHAMITASAATDQVWVAAGTYYPSADFSGNVSPTNVRTKTFVMTSGVAIYGGFSGNGTETLLSQRNWTTNATILSGEIQQDNNASNNSYHVIFNSGNGLTSTAVLDGFTITGGTANGTPNFNSQGGGMYNGGNTSPSVINCTFSGNSANSSGGGMYNEEASLTITNCTFNLNSASSGGGMTNEECAPTITRCAFLNNMGLGGKGGGMWNNRAFAKVSNCTFVNNSANTGGAMHTFFGEPTVTNCTFSGNSATNQGGGIYNETTSRPHPSVLNCTFTGNSATNGGGGIYNSESSPSVINCTFSGNSATTNAGGIHNLDSSPTVANTILWGNGSEIVNVAVLFAGSNPMVTHSIVQGGYAGTGNLNVNPLFVNAADPAGADRIFGTADDGLVLTGHSPALNAGNNTGVTATDITGSPRIFGSIVDMGAYEYQAAPLPVTRLYVDAAKTTGANNGLTWANAFTSLQSALQYGNSQNLTEIWVAAGTYKPSTTGDRNSSFAMKPGVAIYGGFVGNETTLSQRPGVNPITGPGGAAQPSSSTLSGEIGDPASTTDNSIHVVNNPSGLGNTARLDGFVITGGNASVNAFGGGMLNSGSIGTPTGPTVTNCLFVSSSARFGGGMANSNSNPVVTNCQFQTNSGFQGGGMFNQSSNPTVTNCLFAANSTTAGGGLYNSNSSPTLTNCAFQGNSASTTGGAIENFGFQGNAAPVLTNCSFQANSATNTGGTLHGSGFSGSASVVLTNCVVFGNANANAITNGSGGSVTASYSLFDAQITGYTNGGNNLTTTVTPYASTGSTELASNSAAINRGSNAAYTAANGPATDLAGQSRIFPANGQIDMGAYEQQSAPLPVTLRYFNGRMTDGGTSLGWQTAREDNNAHFQIERSRDAVAFESIGTIPTQAADGNSVTPLTYSLLDNQPLPGINYYRLMQTDRDGTRTQAGNVIALSRENQQSVLYPNPVSAAGEASIEPAIAYTGYQISDVLGRVVQRQNGPGVLSRVSLEELPAGVYVLRVQTNAGLVTWRLLR